MIKNKTETDTLSLRQVVLFLCICFWLQIPWRWWTIW